MVKKTLKYKIILVYEHINSRNVIIKTYQLRNIFWMYYNLQLNVTEKSFKKFVKKNVWTALT